LSMRACSSLSDDETMGSGTRRVQRGGRWNSVARAVTEGKDTAAWHRSRVPCAGRRAVLSAHYVTSAAKSCNCRPQRRETGGMKDAECGTIVVATPRVPQSP